MPRLLLLGLLLLLLSLRPLFLRLLLLLPEMWSWCTIYIEVFFSFSTLSLAKSTNPPLLFPQLPPPPQSIMVFMIPTKWLFVQMTKMYVLSLVFLPLPFFFSPLLTIVLSLSFSFRGLLLQFVIFWTVFPTFR